MEVILSFRAESDLEAITDFIAADKPIAAIRFTEQLMTVCLSLATLPRRWPLAPEFGEGVRRAVHGNYLIFYMIHPDRIVIEHIVHGANQAWRTYGD